MTSHTTQDPPEEVRTCPGPEEIAAFVDGRLDEAERRRMLVHLDACPDCYEIFAETMALLDEDLGETAEEPEAPRHAAAGSESPESPESSDGPTADVIAGPWSRRLAPLALPLAALLVVGLGVSLFLVAGPYRTDPADPARAAASLAQGFAPAAGDGLFAYEEWGGTRGADASSTEDYERPAEVRPETAFQLGVLFVDLRVALPRGEAAAPEGSAGGRVAEIRGHLDRALAKVPNAESPKDLLKALLGSADGGTPAAGGPDREELLELLEQSLESRAGTAEFQLGQWAETGRLAALTGNRELLGSRDLRRFEPATDELSEDVRGSVERARALLAGEPGDEELETLGELFRRIVEQAGQRVGWRATEG